MKVCGLTREEDVAAAAEAGADMVGFVLADASPRRALRGAPGAGHLALRRGRRRGAEGDGADLVQLYPPEEGKVRGRDAVLLRDGEEVARGRRSPVAGGGSDAPRARTRAVEGA